MLAGRCCTALAAVLLSAGAVGAQPGPQSGKPRVDGLGDPLPLGALFRIGTTRLQLRSEAYAIAASADGKRIAAVSGDTLGVWELPGGRELFRVPVESNMPWVLAFAPDRKTLAVNRNGNVAVVDAAGGEIVGELHTSVMPSAFAADG